jgi:hypothetical protein
LEMGGEEAEQAVLSKLRMCFVERCVVGVGD